MFHFEEKTYEAVPRSSSSEERVEAIVLKKRPSLLHFSLIAALVFSALANVLLSIQVLLPQHSDCKEITRYAGLASDMPVPYLEETPYNDHNETLANERWTDLSIDIGVVALPDTWVGQKQLPPAQRFPWDRSKGIYVLSAYHSLHCVKSIHQALVDLRNSRPLRRSWEHISHCIDAIRQDIICHADDTPLYTTSSDVPDTGIGQNRQCRDWRKLEEWAKERSGCFRFLDENNEHFPQIERFKFCPEGSSYRALYEKNESH